MKCVKCGYESTAQFTQCPSCAAIQPQGQTGNINAQVSAGSGRIRKKKKKAAIIIAVIVSVLSVVAACIIFTAFTFNVISKNISDDEYGIDSFDDFDSNEYDKEIEDFFKEYYNSSSKYDMTSPAGLNTPITFNETLYSFSEGDVDTEYEVSMINTYRGEAALKLLEGATLPIYNENNYEIYLVQFRLKITNQEKDAIVTLPLSSPAAYPSGSSSILSEDYAVIKNLNYINKFALISKNDDVDTFMAFIIDKNEQSPIILWNSRENKAFKDNGQAVSDAGAVEAGAAIEKKADSESEVSSDPTASN